MECPSDDNKKANLWYASQVAKCRPQKSQQTDAIFDDEGGNPRPIGRGHPAGLDRRQGHGPIGPFPSGKSRTGTRRGHASQPEATMTPRIFLPRR